MTRQPSGCTLAAMNRPESLTAPRTPAPTTVRTRRLGPLTAWLAAVVADNGMRERFDAERRRDEELVQRVDRRRHR